MSKTYVRLEVPKEVQGKKFEQEYVSTAQQVLKEQTVLRLFEQGKISAGYAANVLGMTRHDFMDFLAKHRVSIFNYTYNQEELEKEFQTVDELVKRSKVRRKRKS